MRIGNGLSASENRQIFSARHKIPALFYQRIVMPTTLLGPAKSRNASGRYACGLEKRQTLLAHSPTSSGREDNSIFSVLATSAAAVVCIDVIRYNLATDMMSAQHSFERNHLRNVHQTMRTCIAYNQCETRIY